MATKTSRSSAKAAKDRKPAAAPARAVAKTVSVAKASAKAIRSGRPRSVPIRLGVEAVGIVHNAVLDLTGTDRAWGDVESRIELSPAFEAEALDGIERFSHVEVVFVFHKVPDSEIETGTRHPRDDPRYPKVGIFAQRNKARPNRIGLTICSVVRRDGRTLVVKGLDALDGSPVLDVKPVMQEYLPQGDVRQPGWSHEVLEDYW